MFADRYRAILVEEDLYLKELIRYVHLNPVRAGLVTRPEGNDWSSEGDGDGGVRRAHKHWICGLLASAVLGKMQRQMKGALLAVAWD